MSYCGLPDLECVYPPILSMPLTNTDKPPHNTVVGLAGQSPQDSVNLGHLALLNTNLFIICILKYPEAPLLFCPGDARIQH